MAGQAGATEKTKQRALPDADTCIAILRKMMLIRRFEERAGEMYAKAKVGGFLHLCIGEEATIAGACDALEDSDYLISTYREHGQALARGTEPEAVMAELFGKATGCSGGRGGSMHLFDADRRFMGGYGIVGGNLPIAAGLALASDYRGEPDVTLCMMGDGATNQGTFGETMNLAALWELPVVFLVVNNQFGMGTALDRHSAVTDLSHKAGGFGIPGSKCDGMDVLDTHAVVSKALECARKERKPQLVEAVTYRYRGHSMADPEEYRSKDEVKEWLKRDPLLTFGGRLKDEDIVSDDELEAMDKEAIEKIDQAVKFADESPFPDLDALYDGIYVIGDQVQGWHTVDRRSPNVHPGEAERDAPEVSRKLAAAGAAYAQVDDESSKSERRPEAHEPGHGEPDAERRDEDGGGG